MVKRNGAVECERTSQDSDRDTIEQDLLYGKENSKREVKKHVTERISSCLLRLKKNWRNLAALVCLWVAYLICTAGLSLLGPFFPEEALDKGASDAVIGVIVGTSPFVVAVLSPLLGYLLPRIGVSLYILGGLVLVGSSYTLLGFVTLLPSALVFITACILLRVAEGVGTAMFYTALFSTLPTLCPDSVTMLMGIFQLAAGLGFTLGRPFGGLLYSVGGFRLPFISVGVSVLLMAVPCTLLNRKIPSIGRFVFHSEINRAKNVLSSIISFSIITDLFLIVLVLDVIVAFIAVSNQGAVLQPFLIEKFQLSPLQVSLVFFVLGAAYAVGNLLCGVIKVRGVYLSVFGLVVAAIGEFILALQDYIGVWKLWIVIISMAVTGFGGAFAAVPVYAEMITIAERYVCKADRNSMLTSFLSGIVSASVTFGQFSGPVLSGVITNFLTFPIASFIIGEIVSAQILLLTGVFLVDNYTWR